MNNEQLGASDIAQNEEITNTVDQRVKRDEQLVRTGLDEYLDIYNSLVKMNIKWPKALKKQPVFKVFTRKRIVTRAHLEGQIAKVIHRFGWTDVNRQFDTILSSLASIDFKEFGTTATAAYSLFSTAILIFGTLLEEFHKGLLILFDPRIDGEPSVTLCYKVNRQ